jgi:hypothetical protein
MIQSKHDEMIASQKQSSPDSAEAEATAEPSVVESRPSRLTESTTTILGSFFEKHQAEDDAFNRKYKSVTARLAAEDEDMMQTTTKDWLITPLPCLTSITASQRSIVENDPLENLLIEHPSMSVFVAATSSASNSDTSFIEDDEDMAVDEESSSAAKQVVIVVADVPVVVKKQQPAVLLIAKSVSEKRKVHNSPSPNHSIEHSPSSTLKRNKASKKNKRSAAQNTTPAVSAAAAAANKENVQHESHQQSKNMPLYTAEFFKKQSNAARVEALLLNKNQMKRSNKNSVFASAGAKSANAKHRKYHKLQQPACFQTSKPVF